MYLPHAAGVLCLLAHSGAEGTITALRATNESVTGTVASAATALYRVELSSCRPSDRFLNVELASTEAGGLADSELLLMLNPDDSLPQAVVIDSGEVIFNDGTVGDYAGYKVKRSYQQLALDLSLHRHSTLYAGVFNFPSTPEASDAFTIRAWCTGADRDLRLLCWMCPSGHRECKHVSYSLHHMHVATSVTRPHTTLKIAPLMVQPILTILLACHIAATPACPAMCSHHGVCRSDGTCLCSSGWADIDCNTEAMPLGDRPSIWQSLQPGHWMYFMVQVPEKKSSLLVQMIRTRGSTILFLLPLGEGFVPNGVPTQEDYETFADKEAYQTHADYHHRLLRSVGPGTFIVGVFNTDRDLEESANFSITATVSPATGSPLCPLACSAPSGVCVASNRGNATGYCACRPGSGGQFCEGNLTLMHQKSKVDGVLAPGQWAYFQLGQQGSASLKNLVIKLTRDGGQAVLVEKLGSYPTLDVYDEILKPTAPVGSNLSIYTLYSGSEIDSGTHYYGLYNLDYTVHDTCHYILEFTDSAGTASGLSPWLAVGLGAAISILLCICTTAVAQQNVQMRQDLQGQPLDPALIASLPTFRFRVQPVDNKEDAQYGSGHIPYASCCSADMSFVTKGTYDNPT
eukprot:SM000256S08677  [mRNA]  locus=s256:62645:66501:+ [translate_table: standard]